MRRGTHTTRAGKAKSRSLGARRRTATRTGAMLITLSLFILMAAASTASATRPLHEKSSFSASFDLAAGELCDFAYHQDGKLKYAGRVGAFEGAIYEARGYYRPEVDCIMFSRTNHFCAVCRRAIERIIRMYARG